MTGSDHRLNVCYFAIRSTLDGNGYIGAALVVDAKGIPLEFRCSVPVRPSAIQTALYGAPIKDYIAFNLCGQPLLGSLTTNPELCLVESESEFNLQEHVSIPVFHACRVESHSESDSREDSGQDKLRRQSSSSRAPDGPAANPSGERAKASEEDGIRLDSPADFPPVILRSYSDWDRSLQHFLPGLRRLSENIDLVEPFERITVGCRLLCQEDKRFK